MARAVPRKVVYAATVMAILALAGGWTLAGGSGAQTGPAQLSQVTVTTPGNFHTAVVKDTQILTVSSALVSGLTPAGVQATGTNPGHGLNSTGTTANAVLAACAALYCAANYSAVDPSSIVLGDSALQVMLNVTQPTPSSSAVGFDVQVEVIYTVSTAPSVNVYAFGTGYFDTGTNSLSSTVTTPGPTYYAVALYVDLGTAATNIPSVQSVVVTMNQCLVATVCP